MGAYSFITTSQGKNADDAFRKAVEQAQFESGHGGYTGTIAEKHSGGFVMITMTITDVRNNYNLRLEILGRITKELQSNAITPDQAIENAKLELDWDVKHTKGNVYRELVAEKKRVRGFRNELKNHRGQLQKAQGVAMHLISLDDRRISDKWGPAGCIEATKGTFVFFGYASS